MNSLKGRPVISLPAQIQQPSMLDRAQHRMANQHQELSLLPEDEIESNLIDSLRSLTANKTVEVLVVAFVMGGFLGWLTSKR